MVTNTDIITAEIVDAAYHLHKGLGPGLLESVYERLLAKELVRRGLQVERQRAVPFEYDGLRFDGELKVDLLVNDRVVVELKAVEQIQPVHLRQTFTYLRLLNLEVALLLNFGAPLMKDGIRRIVHNYRPTQQSRLRIHS
jgi:GxxExxY protein